MIKLLELFGGIGAPRKALENLVEVKSIDYVEVLPQAVNAYNSLFDNNYKPTNILDWNMDIDILVHGSPCQDFSNAGKMDLSSGRSLLYLKTLEIIGNGLNKRPKYVIWENVPSVLSKRFKDHFNHYLMTMKSYGYRNYYNVLDSRDFGIPQGRKRLFVVSSLKKEINLDYLPKKEMKPLKDFIENYKVSDKFTITCPSMLNIIGKKVRVLDINNPKEYTSTITTKQMRWNNAGVIEYSKGLYRVLTPLECWRLMGFSDNDFNKVRYLRDSTLYLLAGNSIVVNVLEEIFKEILGL